MRLNECEINLFYCATSKYVSNENVEDFAPYLACADGCNYFEEKEILALVWFFDAQNNDQ